MAIKIVSTTPPKPRGQQVALAAGVPVVEAGDAERHQSRVQEALGLEPTGRTSPRLNLRLTEGEVEFLDGYRGQVSRNDFIRLLLRAADKLV